MKYLFYDLETTGVKHWKHGIHQIAGIVVIGGEVKESFDIKMQPYEKVEITDEALAFAGITREDLAGYQDMANGKADFTSMLNKYVDRFNKKDKFHLVGFNNRAFDDKFLRAFFEYNGDNYFGSWFWPDSLDVLVLASFALREERTELPDFKLESVAKHLGIDFDPEAAHDALYDVQITKQIFEILEIL